MAINRNFLRSSLIWLFLLSPDIIICQTKIFTSDSINFSEWNYNQRKIVRTNSFQWEREIAIIAESSDRIYYSQNLSNPVKIFDGKNATLAVDNNSTTYIVFEDNGIKYSFRNDTDNWAPSILISESSEIGYSPIADCDKGGNLHILFGVKDSITEGAGYLSSLRYVKVTKDTHDISSTIYSLEGNSDKDTLVNYAIATDLLFMDETIFIVYQLSNDSIYVHYSVDNGENWAFEIAFPGTHPSISVGFGHNYFSKPMPYPEPFYPPYEPNPVLANDITCPVILYRDADSNLLNRSAEYNSNYNGFYWDVGKIIQNGPIDYSCIDDFITTWFQPFGYSYIFQKNSLLFHAFTNSENSIIRDTITNNAIVSSIAYKQFNSWEVDIIWYEMNQDTCELYYQSFSKTPRIQFETIVNDVTCTGVEDGSVTLTIFGGIPPYTITFYNMESPYDYGVTLTDSKTEYTFDELFSGKYMFSISDVSGYFDFIYEYNFYVDIVEPSPVETGHVLGDTIVQQSSIVSYSVNDTSRSTYNWEIIGGGIISGQGLDSIEVQWGQIGTGIIKVVEIDTNGCIGDTVSLEVEIGSTHIGFNHENSLKIYPNPFTNTAILSINNPERNSYTLYIKDLSGKIVKSINNVTERKTEITRDGLPAGLYLLELRGPKIYRGKIIIQ